MGSIIIRGDFTKELKRKIDRNISWRCFNRVCNMGVQSLMQMLKVFEKCYMKLME